MILEKRALRWRIKAWRTGLTAEDRRRAAAALAGHGLGFLAPAPGTAVSGFASLDDELDCGPLLQRLAGGGMRLALPVVQGKGLPLLFRAWAPGDVMGSGVWGIAEPVADSPAIEPDIVLVPLLAFDRTGRRIGYGGGFYDRTLRQLRARKPIVAVGLAYDEQRVDAVPHLDYDERLDWVLTPSGPIRCIG
ncbi:MAG: 5-formyltetrahydrofolate cyclo-ligase [Hyphomicrobiaceae bacterium]|nr:MAG: 5-formyltetrahydrofolate cyclo-ligase [Hyphomicrobiaceae bacterium]